MKIDQKKIIGYLIIAGVLCVAVIVFWNTSPRDDVSPASETARSTSTSDALQPSIIEIASSTSSGAIPLPIPVLNRPLIFPSSITDAQREKTQTRIAELNALLEKNPRAFDTWMELGLLRKSINDFEGARQAWEYAGLLLPLNTQSFLNLHDLYAYYLHDNTLALKNIEIAIQNDPKSGMGYAQLYAFYTDVTKEREKAIAVLERAIAAHVGDEEQFQQELNRVTAGN
ncbi:MAG: hypothetical protein AAB343_01320 [Patescibacteria group bacterium]